MKQKLALACTLVHEPEVILLDEPTTGVDPVSRREFWKLLSQFLTTGITILMSTPYLDEAERCTRVALLDRGRLMAVDTPGSLRSSLAGTMFEVVSTDVQQARAALARHGIDAQVFGDRLHVWGAEKNEPADSPAALKEQLSTLLPGSRIRTITPSLEDVYIARMTELRP